MSHVNFLGRFCWTNKGLFACRMSHTRFFTFHEGEKVMIRARTMGLITIEFNTQVATISQTRDGSISLKLEDRHEDSDTEIDEGSDTEIDEDSDTETCRSITTPPVVRYYAGGGFETVNLKHQSRLEEMQDIEDLQCDLFGDN